MRIVLIAGMSCDLQLLLLLYCFCFLLRLICPRHHDVAFLKGVDNYKLSVLAADVKEAVAALGHVSCTLMGHDWGGLVAWTTAGEQ